MKKEQLIKKINEVRKMLDFLESRADVFSGGDYEYVSFNCHISAHPHNRHRFLELSKALSGFKKSTYDPANNIIATKEFGKEVGDAKISVWGDRAECCTRKVIGTEIVKKQVPVKFEEQEVVQEIVEWECGPFTKKEPANVKLQ